ncbi:unnamed protein product [Closterium sp. Naga37s-1]|nr:unnamed protein product [Closterium sp. Naga37s-1]
MAWRSPLPSSLSPSALVGGLSSPLLPAPLPCIFPPAPRESACSRDEMADAFLEVRRGRGERWARGMGDVGAAKGLGEGRVGGEEGMENESGCSQDEIADAFLEARRGRGERRAGRVVGRAGTADRMETSQSIPSFTFPPVPFPPLSSPCQVCEDRVPAVADRMVYEDRVLPADHKLAQDMRERTVDAPAGGGSLGGGVGIRLAVQVAVRADHRLAGGSAQASRPAIRCECVHQHVRSARAYERSEKDTACSGKGGPRGGVRLVWRGQVGAGPAAGRLAAAAGRVSGAGWARWA